MSVIQTPNGWCVFNDGKMVAGPFETNSQAWQWIDARDVNATEMDNTKRRIGNAFSDR